MNIFHISDTCEVCEHVTYVRGRLKCDGTRAETRFRLSAKRTSPFKSAGASVQATNGSRGVRISGNNAGYTMFRGSVKSTGYPLQSPVSPSVPLPCVTVCHHISTAVYPQTHSPNVDFKVPSQRSSDQRVFWDTTQRIVAIRYRRCGTT